MSDNVEQLTLWGEMYPYYKIKQPVILLEMFAGIGSMRKALSILNVKVDEEKSKICEWAYNSYCSYNAIHIKDKADYSIGKTKEELVNRVLGTSMNYNEPLSLEALSKKPIEWLRNAYNNIIATHNLVNIMEVKGKDLGELPKEQTSILMYSFPCLTEDTLVLTENGYKKIIDVKIGQKVLTHTGNYQKVSNWWCNGKHETLKINAAPFDELVLTKNHKVFTQEGWIEARYLQPRDMLGLKINTIEEIPNYQGIDYVWKDGRKSRHSQKIDMTNPNFWWVVGRYIGDGWLRQQGGIVICCDKKELNEITTKLNGMFNYSVVDEKAIYKVHIPIKELSIYLEQYGVGAENKHLGKDILNLPIDLLNEFLEGYLSADGCKYNNVVQCNSVSKQLIYDIAQCYAKVHKRPYSIYKITPPTTKTIQGRIVNQKPWYQMRVRETEKSKSYYDEANDIIWFPINSIEENGEQLVYDIEVEIDHSFIANSTIVHNCQDLSLSGLRKGMAVSQKDGGTRSGLLWEIERILVERERESNADNYHQSSGELRWGYECEYETDKGNYP